jgi:hypothetical protein
MRIFLKAPLSRRSIPIGQVYRRDILEDVTVMGRTIAGSLLVGWSFIVIPSNLGLPGYEGDLIFGFFLLIFGSILAYSGARKIGISTQSSDSSAAPEPSSGHSVSNGATQGVLLQILIGVVGGVVSGLILKYLGA